MKKYDWVLFDADDTLFHFDAFSGLRLMFSRFGVSFSKIDYQEYQTINKPLWVCYQNGEITAKELQERRFTSWANKLQITTQTLNSEFLAAMVELCTPIAGAVNLLDTLKGNAKLGIITNGFTELQHARLERTGLKHYFDLLVISEQVGIAKPHRGIFDYAYSFMGEQDRNKVLMVGDNPDSDILGGLNAGFHTCWVNANKKPIPEGISPHYHVASLKELEHLLQYEG